MLRPAFISVTVVALACVARDVVAQELPRARLEFASSAQTQRCVDETQLRQLVAARLGRDPFDPTASLVVRVRLERARAAIRATVTRADGGSASAPRVIASRRIDCGDLGPALGLAVSMMIDPLARTPDAQPVAAPVEAPRPRPQPLPDPPREPPAALARNTVVTLAPPRLVPAAPAPSARPLPVALYAMIAPAVSFAALPTVALGPELLLALQLGAFGLALSGRFDAAWPSSFDSFVVHSTLASGSLRVCGAPSTSAARTVVIELCGLASVGAFAANATMLDQSTPSTSLYAAAGAELATSVRFSRWFGLRVGVEGAATLVRARQTITEQGRERELWLAPPFSVTASAGPTLYFL